MIPASGTVIAPYDSQLKPIYIYPGLLRIVREKAIALDNQCPAVLYKCTMCRRERDKATATAAAERAAAWAAVFDGKFAVKDDVADDDGLTDGAPVSCASTASVATVASAPACPLSGAAGTAMRSRRNAVRLGSEIMAECPHQMACAICLDEFHGKDLVRKLPCNSNHVFHSKCILDWFVSHQRCPLCNEPVVRAQGKATACDVDRTSGARTQAQVQVQGQAPGHRSGHGHGHGQVRLRARTRRAPSDLLAEGRRVRVPRSVRRASALQGESLSPLSPPPSTRSGHASPHATHLRRHATRSEHETAPHVARSATRTMMATPRPQSLPQTSMEVQMDSRVQPEPQSSRSVHWRYSRHARHDSASTTAVSEAGASASTDVAAGDDAAGMTQRGSLSCGEDACGDSPTIEGGGGGGGGGGSVGGRKAASIGSHEKARRKNRGPRTYSYIVHDNVRMEMNPFIPV